MSAKSVEHILKTLHRQIYVDYLSLLVEIISADIIAMSIDLILSKEVSKSSNFYR